MRKKERLNLQVFLTNRCNLACSYCFQHHFEQSFNFDAFIKSVWELKSLLSPKELSVMFCGGEPFVAFEEIKAVVDFIAKEFDNIPVIFYVTTNGTLLTPDIVEYIAEKNIDISVSIDGRQDLHDKNRLFSNGQGTFDVVNKNLKLLRDNEVPVCIKTVVSDLSTVKDTYLYIKQQWNPESFFLSECIGKTVIVKSQYEMEHYSRLWREIIDMELDCFFKDGTWSLIRFSSLLKRLFAKEKYLAFCDACNGTYCIFLNGDIYPCYRAAEFPEFKLDAGSIKKADTLFMKGISKKVNETCSDCGILQLCGGGCAINSYEFGGEIANIYEPDCQMCRMYGELVLYMLGKIIKLPFDDIKKILRIGA